MPNAAQTYFNSFSKAAQDQIRASWGGENLLDAWFQNAQKAGAVDAQGGGGASQRDRGGDATGGGNNAGKVTPDDVRANAKKFGLPEDYARFSDNELRAWLRDHNYNMETGKFTNNYGDQVDKPDERGPNTPEGVNGTGDKGVYKSGPGAHGSSGGPGASGGKGAPAKPSTFGKQLSYTGDPMTDMLLYQFNNTARAAEAGGGQNIMGLGEDMQAGGEGDNEDKGGFGQLLSGGGLWRAMSKDAFGGFRADQKNTADPKKKKRRGRGRNAVAPTPEEIAAPPGVAPPQDQKASPSLPQYKSDVLYGGDSNKMRDMMQKNYGGNFGGDSYL